MMVILSLMPSVLACRAAMVLDALLGASPTAQAADERGSVRNLELATLSTRPDTVSGGDVLVEVRLPQDVRPRNVEVTLNGREITGALRFDREGQRLLGLVSGLTPGRNFLRASVEGDRGRGRHDADAQ